MAKLDLKGSEQVLDLRGCLYPCRLLLNLNNRGEAVGIKLREKRGDRWPMATRVKFEPPSVLSERYDAGPCVRLRWC